MAPRPVAKPALTAETSATTAALPKAPHKEHPAAPQTPEPVAPAPRTRAKRTPPLKMFSVRLGTAVLRRTKLYAVATETSLQEITEAALTEYMNNHPAKTSSSKHSYL
jgi:hypothetical protein